MVFDYFHKLKHLDLEDNFLESNDGLPRNFKAMADLEEFKASYNLMSGPLDNGVLETLQKLSKYSIDVMGVVYGCVIELCVWWRPSRVAILYLLVEVNATLTTTDTHTPYRTSHTAHLEIESNFLTGALPFLGEMPALEYVYLRRNSLSSHLNFLKSGQLTNLFSIWLDGNDITRTIPTQVGHLTSLASMSVTNASLTGTIPTEFAILPLLNRLWLYGNELNGTVPEALENITKLEILEIQDNKLTGTMPSGICDTIRKSEYENKALVADCEEVKCNDCCTKCA